MTTKTLAELIRERGTLKSFFTRFQTAFNNTNADDTKQLAILKARCRDKRFFNGLNIFNNIQNQIEKFDPSDHTAHHDKEREIFENTYFHITASAVALLSDHNALDESIQKLMDTAENPDSIQNSNKIENQIISSQSVKSHPNSIHDSHYTTVYNDSNQELHDNKTKSINNGIELNLRNIPEKLNRNEATIEHSYNIKNLKLPPVQIPHFSGAYDQWLNFRDTFKSLIHCNDQIPAIMKFYYLKNALEGDAALIIKAIEPSSSNYFIAWDMLYERFENQPFIINSHVKAIFECEAIEKESHCSLQTLSSCITTNLRVLKSLGEPTEYWDTLIIYIINSKLDNYNKIAWAKYAAKLIDRPTVHDIHNFLTEKCKLLESMVLAKNKQSNKSKSYSSSYVSQDSTQNAEEHLCKICSGNHPIFYCTQFLHLSIPERVKKITNLNLCKNCFKLHLTKHCKSRFSCKKCKGRHNTLLHIGINKQTGNSVNCHESNTQNHSESTVAEECPDSMNANITLTTMITRVQVLLPTALVYINDSSNQKHLCRVLLDSCSQSNYISENFINRLKLHTQNVKQFITGINNIQSQVKKRCEVTFQSRFNNYKCHLSCLVIPTITSALPEISFNKSYMQVPKNLQLADPDFNQKNEIDALIGAELFWQLVCIGQIKLDKNSPICQKTHFGWIITGPMSIKENLLLKNSNSDNVNVNDNCLLIKTANNHLETQLEQFWKVEEIHKPTLKTKEHQQCETLYSNTTFRQEGKFVVRLPFKSHKLDLGQSYSIANQRFNYLEKRFNSQPEFKQMYTEFIEEYIKLGHMSAINYSTKDLEKAYFLPHHAVLKTDRTTTKLRVVFDASCKTTTGISLNDILMVGGNVQSDLLSILLDFRVHKYAFSSDCEKMYRQVLVHKEDRIYQNIVWRSDDSKPIQIYQLNTVTYGTASAAFLATRCLKQVSMDIQKSKPVIADIIDSHFYVDDLIASVDDLNTGEMIIQEISSILNTYGFNLRKWTSNHPRLCKGIINKNVEMLFSDVNSSVKILGLSWNPQSDTFNFKNHCDDHHKSITKRTILSSISKLFDPLGLIAPVIVEAKIILQSIWQLKTDWDESISTELFTTWKVFQGNLSQINEIIIPRFCCTPESDHIQLHGFADASEKAYGACIYLRSSKNNKQVVHLLCAKSKIAPLKRISLPKLELCAALLLVRLKESVVKALKLKIDKYYYWSDSTITLAWISIPSHQLKPFVANRITEILETTNNSEWRHISSGDNPADIVSRGMSPQKLSKCNLWWNGPSWLQREETHWYMPTTSSSITNVPEIRTKNVNLLINTKQDQFLAKFINSYSSITKLQRILAYVFRFLHNLKVTKSERILQPLSVAELEKTLSILIKTVQEESFSTELKCLTKGKEINLDSPLISLNPFVKDGLIRVGGRIENSNVSFNQKHPLLLPNKHHLTALIIIREHLRTLHGGAQLVLSTIRLKFWPIHGMSAVKRVIRSCVLCKRANPIFLNPLMGNLPSGRIVPSRPFSECGIDYAGPFLVKELTRSGRRGPPTKAYLAIFICFATKAVHIEVVSNLSTESFLNALKRFVSRRGICKKIHSDNATNFQGANNLLSEWYSLISSRSHNDIIFEYCASCSIEWQFIPARSPNFGGLWEAAVKSIKGHLTKIMYNITLTFEELTTISTQIEAILNSRPLLPQSCDPDDFHVLTPAHFLVGEQLIAVPEPSNSIEANISHLNRYQLIRHVQQQVWSQWSKEYLQLLQVRNKNQRKRDNRTLEVGSLVIFKESSPSLYWRRGRVIDTHPGNDGVIRVVTVKTATSVLKRAVNQLVELLPPTINP